MTPGMSPNANLDNIDLEVPKTAVLDEELQSRKVKIATLQGTGTESIQENNYTFYWFGRPQDRLFGTGPASTE